jgi:hypothetical protein
MAITRPEPHDTDAIIRQYAERFVEDGYQHETPQEFAEQVAADLMEPSIKQRVVAAIRQMQRRTA